MFERTYTICNLPQAGLGNKLLVWAKAAAFADLNHLPLLVSPWYQANLGWLQGRYRSPRFYFGQLKSQSWTKQLFRLFLLSTKQSVVEPEVRVLSQIPENSCIYVFENLIHGLKMFENLKPHRYFLYEHLLDLVHPSCLQKVEQANKPVIAVHIRRGDFRLLNSGEDFGTVTAVRTPLSYFVNVVQGIRQIAGYDVALQLFSDGVPDELQDILALPNVTFVMDNPPIVDMLLMAHAKIIIPSPTSSFSQWSAFLSNATIIHHPEHFRTTIRDEETNRQWYEGPLPDNIASPPDLLVKNINELPS